MPNSSLSETVYCRILLLSETDLILSCIIRHHEIKAYSYEFVLTKKGGYYSTIPRKWILIFVFLIIFLYSFVFVFLFFFFNNPRQASIPLYKANGGWGWGERFSTKLNPKLLGLIKMSISWCHLYLFFPFHLKYGHSFSGSIWFPLPHLSVWEWVFLHQLKNILGLCLQQFKMHSSSTESIFQLYI